MYSLVTPTAMMNIRTKETPRPGYNQRLNLGTPEKETRRGSNGQRDMLVTSHPSLCPVWTHQHVPLFQKELLSSSTSSWYSVVMVSVLVFVSVRKMKAEQTKRASNTELQVNGHRTHFELENTR
ncbi:hypothetical protein GOODEAATRI_023924 [Goodea atripinnis]|uniref:Uncharacterized protein n=1 Tax=Goodea atripinnis TaxID=208336 RepID=A0ABV0MK93_9TELE